MIKKKQGFIPIPMPILYWMVAIYLIIGAVLFVWAGLSVNWWDVKTIFTWPYVLYLINSLSGAIL
jgi:hypothetical protein